MTEDNKILSEKLKIVFSMMKQFGVTEYTSEDGMKVTLPLSGEDVPSSKIPTSDEEEELLYYSSEVE